MPPQPEADGANMPADAPAAPSPGADAGPSPAPTAAPGLEPAAADAAAPDTATRDTGAAVASTSAAADGTTSAAPTLLDRLPLWTAPAILVAVPLVAWLLVQANPDLFYDRIVWKYYWGPIKADAENVETLVHAGVAAHSGYNVVNTASWAVLLGVCVLGAAQMLRRFEASMDRTLIYGATAWVVAGSIAHTLEDTALIEPPLQYLFITPIIYVLFAIFGILAFLLGQYLVRVGRSHSVGLALTKLWLILSALVLGWLFVWLESWQELKHVIHPLWVAGLTFATHLSIRARALKAGRVDPAGLVLHLGILATLLTLVYVWDFLGDPWFPQSPRRMELAFLWAPLAALGVVAFIAALPSRVRIWFTLGLGAVVVPPVAIAVLGALVQRAGRTFDPHGNTLLAVWGLGAVAVLVYGASRLRKADPDMHDAARRAFRDPVNLLLIFAQACDGIATALGLDLRNYEEKHVLSRKVIESSQELGHATGLDLLVDYPTFTGFVAVKVLLALVVVYVIDVQGRKDSQSHPVVIGLVKFAVIMVGLGPGIRDFSRLSLGV